MGLRAIDWLRRVFMGTGRRRLFVRTMVVVGLSLTPPSGPAYAQAVRNATAVSGSVVDASTKRPLENALVELTVGNFSDRQLTDAKGRFVFPDLADGGFGTVRVSKPGFLVGGLGAGIAVSGGPVSIQKGQWLRDLSVELSRPASIAGTVRDEDGEPFVGATVQAVARIDLYGGAFMAAGPRTQTDEAGRYEISDLLPGSYLVLVPPSGPPHAHSLAVFPGGNVSGTPLDVTFGRDLVGVDFNLQRVPVFRLSGTVVGAGPAQNGITVRLVPAPEMCASCSIASAVTGAGGRFSFEQIPAGQYWLDVRGAVAGLLVSASPFASEISSWAGTRGGNLSGELREIQAGRPGLQYATSRSAPNRDFIGQLQISIDRDLADIAVSVRTTATVAGQLVIEASPDAPKPSMDPRLLIRLDPADPSSLLPALSSERPANDNQTFAIRGVPPGRYFVRAAGDGWILKSVSWKNSDVTDTAIDVDDTGVDGLSVTVTNRRGALTGQVVDGGGAPVQRGRVVIFPKDETTWTAPGLWPTRIRVVDVGSGGVFQIDDLPAGAYLAAAIGVSAENITVTTLRNSKALAKPITLLWGETQNVQLVERVR